MSGSRKNNKTKKNKTKKNKNSKKVVIYKCHPSFNGKRPLFHKVKLHHYDTELDTYKLDISRVIESIFQRFKLDINGTGFIDIFCNHPEVLDYKELAKYDQHFGELVCNELIFIYEKAKKGQKKKNESLEWMVKAKTESNASQLTMDLNLNIYSRDFWQDIENSFNSADYAKSINKNISRKKKKRIAITDNVNINNNNNNNNNNMRLNKISSKRNHWACEYCTFASNPTTTNHCICCNNLKTSTTSPAIQQNEENKTNEQNKTKKSNINDITEDISDLMGSDESSSDSDIDLGTNKNRKKRKQNVVDNINNEYKPPTKKQKVFDNTNNDITNINNDDMDVDNDNNINIPNINNIQIANVDPQTTLQNMEQRHTFLKGADMKITNVEEWRILLHRFCALRKIDEGLGCAPIGVLSGCGSKTTCKNYQRSYISFLSRNEIRKQQQLPSISIPVNLKITSFAAWIKDKFDANNVADFIKNVTKPGSQRPCVDDVDIVQKDVAEQEKIMRKRKKIWKTWKSIKKTIPKSN